MIKHLTRMELRESYNEVTKEKGKATEGNIFCENQLFTEVANVLCAYDECTIIYENSRWDVSPHTFLAGQYASDRVYIGKVYANEWYTPEQRKAMHEVAFGYMF